MKRLENKIAVVTAAAQGYKNFINIFLYFKK
jgi:hypothetical protein